MATKEQKKENLKQQIIAAANAYSRDLAGTLDSTLFVLNDVTDCYRLLPGVPSCIEKDPPKWV